MAEVNYCYRCGRHVGAGAGKCWYCSAPTRRVIRPNRRCPYCDEPIRPKAVKCHHCGEFLDGRKEQEAAAQKQAGPTFVIEKAIIQTDRAGLPGSPPHPLIDTPEHGRLERPRDLLEAPKKEDDSQVEAEAARPDEEPPEPPDSQKKAEASSRSKEIVPVAPNEKSVALRTGQDGERDVIVRDYASELPAKLSPLFNRSKPKKAEKTDDTIDVRPASDEDNYRLCTVCQTEILVNDNYCFHCGQKYHSGEFDPKEKPKEHSVAIHYALIAILASAQVMAPIMIESNRAVGASRVAFGIAAAGIPLVCIAAFFWKRKFINQAFSLVLLAASVVASLMFWPE